ncbi:HAD-like protein [Ganoderma leucocontextum]|nr:HAD-like protein [Ganoderma leucocontextum]
MPSRQCDNIIVDLGHVLFTWAMRSSDPHTLVPPEKLRRMLNSATWYEYENGNLEEEECFTRLSSEYSLPTSDISTTIRACRDSLRVDREVFAFLRGLKARTGVRLFAMSNIAYPDWEVLNTKAEPQDWALFDDIVISASAGERKPNLGFYRHVIHSTGIDPRRTAFVDDKVANVLTAMSFGMKGFVFTELEELSRWLRQLLRDPTTEAAKWLRAQPKPIWSVTDTGVTVQDSFAQLLILELTRDNTLVEVARPPRLNNFFIAGDGVFTTAKFPDDLDTTSLTCTVLDHFTAEVKNEIMDEMLNYKNRDGIMQVYFADDRPRFDPCVCVTILAFFYANDRGDDLPETLDFVYNTLDNRAYDNGTAYYLGGDPFFFFLSRLLRLSKSPSLRERFSALFAERVQERFGLPGDALTLAMRILAAAAVGIRDVQDYQRLLSLQEDDGSWPLGWMYIYGLSGVRIGNKGLATAMALAAIQRYRACKVGAGGSDGNVDGGSSAREKL